MGAIGFRRVLRFTLGAAMLSAVLGATSGPARITLAGTYRLLAIDGPHAPGRSRSS